MICRDSPVIKAKLPCRVSFATHGPLLTLTEAYGAAMQLQAWHIKHLLIIAVCFMQRSDPAHQISRLYGSVRGNWLEQGRPVS